MKMNMLKVSSVLRSASTSVTLKHRASSLLHTSSVARDIFKVQDVADFDQKVLKSKEPVVVDFFATWCGPCKILEPRLEVCVGRKNDKLHLAKVDVDEQEELAAKYQISSLPSVFVFKSGRVVDKFIGLQDEDQIRVFIDKAIGS